MYTYYSMELISTTFCFIAIMIILLSINQSFNDVLGVHDTSFKGDE